MNDEQMDDRRSTKPLPGCSGERFDASGIVRRSTRRAGPLLAARFVADLDRIPRYALQSAHAGSAKIGSGAIPFESPEGL
ncbi:MAG TPA: hypothetical protein VJN94_05290 [Candidatus Binataceae bacterium]|nr:hypothetical protein [Candidatus Binataceae bacterium]